MEDEVEETALDRLKAAVKGRPAKSYSEVLATDVVEVAASIPEGRHSSITRANRDGAAAAIADTNNAGLGLVVLQITGQVAHLVAVGETIAKEKAAAKAAEEAKREPVPESKDLADGEGGSRGG